jgi:hypothetical protein
MFFQPGGPVTGLGENLKEMKMSLNKGICKILVGCGAVLLLTTPVMADSVKMSGKMCSISSDGTQLVSAGDDLLAGKGKGKGHGPGDGTGGGEAPGDGSGYGPGDCTSGVFSFDPSQSLARGGAGNGGAGNGGHGPGDGTGNGGTGPGDGTGNGPGTGTCTNV